MNGCSFQKVYGKIWVGFVLTLENAFSQSFHFEANRKSIDSPKKTVLGIFKITLRLRDRHVFMWQSLEILTDFNILTLKQIFWKTKTFFKRLDYRFSVESTKIENASFHKKLTYQQPMLRKMEWWLQNGPISKNGVLPATTLFFENFVSV